jgi:hypothetical protein
MMQEDERTEAARKRHKRRVTDRGKEWDISYEHSIEHDTNSGAWIARLVLHDPPAAARGSTLFLKSARLVSLLLG